MPKIRVEMDQKLLGEFANLGTLLEKMGNLIEALDELYTEFQSVQSSVQGSIDQVSKGLALAQSSEDTPAAVRQAAVEASSAAGMTIFYILSHAPQLLHVMSQLGDLKDFDKLDSSERRKIADRLKQEGKNLKEMPTRLALELEKPSRRSRARSA